MEPVELPSDFKEFLNLLNQAHVEYLVIGGYAVGYHGYPRATNGLDVWVGTDSANIEKLLGVLRQFGFNNPQLEQWKTNPEKTLRMGHAPVRIEVLTSIAGVDFAEAFRSRVNDVLDGIRDSLISRPDLRTNKKAAGRLKDLADLENLP